MSLNTDITPKTLISSHARSGAIHVFFHIHNENNLYYTYVDKTVGK